MYMYINLFACVHISIHTQYIVLLFCNVTFLMQIKTVLSAEPHGKQAEKRKKEVTELETKV